MRPGTRHKKVQRTAIHTLILLLTIASMLLFQLPAQAAPAAPSGLLATLNAIPPPSVTLTWADNSNPPADETGFVVERSVDLFTTVETDFTVPANTTLFVDTTVVAGTTYSYRLRSVDGTGSSAPSNVRTVTVPGGGAPPPGGGGTPPAISLVTPPAPPSIQSGAPNIVEIDITSADSTIDTVRWQVQMPAPGASGFDAMEIFAQVAPPVFTGAGDNTPVAGAAQVAAALPDARALFVIFGNVDSINGTVWRIGSPSITINAPVGTPPLAVGTTVRVVGERQLLGGPIMAEAIAQRAPGPAGPPVIENAFLWNGTIVAPPADLGTAGVWELDAGVQEVPDVAGDNVFFNHVVGAALPTAPDPGMVAGVAATVEFTPSAAAGTPGAPPVNSALEIFGQAPANLTPRTTGPIVNNDIGVSLSAPAGSVVGFVIFGDIVSADQANGVWVIDAGLASDITVYENIGTGIDFRPGATGAAGDTVRIVAARSIAPGPIVAEVIRVDVPGGFAPLVEQVFLLDGTISALNTVAGTATVTTPAGAVNFVLDAAVAIDAGIVVGSAVTMEFIVAGGAPPPDTALWGPLTQNPATGLYQSTVTLPPLSSPSVAWIYVEATDALGRVNIVVFDNTLTAVATVAPSAPGSLAASLAGTTGINLSWLDSNTESVFRVDRTTEASFIEDDPLTQAFEQNYNSILVPANRLTFSDTNIVQGTIYLYRVMAVNGAGTTSSNEVSILADVPIPPSNVQGVVVSANQINLTWTDNSNTETGFVIERTTVTGGLGGTPGTYAEVGTAPASTGIGATVTFVDTSALTPDTVFSYRVIAINGIGPSAPAAAEVAVGQIASQPTVTGIALVDSDDVTAGVQVGVKLDWTDIANETNTHVHRVTVPGGAVNHFLLDPDILTFTDTTVTIGQTYAYSVHGTNALGDGPASETLTITVAIPTSPAGLTAAVVSGTQVDLAWTDLGNEDGYTINRSVDGVPDAAPLATPARDITTFQDNTVTLGHLYSYQITATNVLGTSAASTVEASTEPPPAPVLVNPLPGPGGIQATGEVVLTWNNVANEAGYRVMRASATAPGVFDTPTQIAEVGVDVFTYPDNTALPATEYQYTVVAFNGLGTSPSNTVTVTTATPTAPPAGPSALTATALASAVVQLNWTDNSANESGFRVERAPDDAGNPGTFAPVGPILDANTLVMNDSTAAASTRYHYQVIAVNSAGDSATSNIVAVTTTTKGPPPVASFNMSVAIGAAPLMVSFSDTSTEMPTSWSWDFGDGNVSNAQNPTNMYATAGFFTITLTVTNDGGTSSVSRNIVVNPPAPAGPAQPVGGFVGGFVGGAVGGSSAGLSSATAQLAVDEAGTVQSKATLATSGGQATVTIPQGTRIRSQGGQPVAALTAVPLTAALSAPPGNTVMQAADFGPDGAQFNPPITLTMTYNPAMLPPNARQDKLRVAYWDGSKWVKLSSTVDPATMTITAQIDHFTIFAVIAEEGEPTDTVLASLVAANALNVAFSPDAANPGKFLSFIPGVSGNSLDTVVNFQTLIINVTEEGQAIPAECKGQPGQTTLSRGVNFLTYAP